MSKSKWIDPAVKLPPTGVRILVARIYEPKEPPIVEQAWYYPGGNLPWKVYGTRLARVIAWRPMPEFPGVTQDD